MSVLPRQPGGSGAAQVRRVSRGIRLRSTKVSTEGDSRGYIDHGINTERDGTAAAGTGDGTLAQSELSVPPHAA